MKKHISKLLVCCLALGAILIPTASAAEGIYEDFSFSQETRMMSVILVSKAPEEMPL